MQDRESGVMLGLWWQTKHCIILDTSRLTLLMPGSQKRTGVGARGVGSRGGGCGHSAVHIVGQVLLSVCSPACGTGAAAVCCLCPVRTAVRCPKRALQATEHSQ